MCTLVTPAGVMKHCSAGAGSARKTDGEDPRGAHAIAEMFPMRLPLSSVNQTPPSGPGVMPQGPLPLCIPYGGSASPLPGSTRSISSTPWSVTHMAPSGPAAIPVGRLLPELSGYSVTLPAGSILATLPMADSVNHMFPSGPAAIPSGPTGSLGTGYSAIVPDGEILPMRPAASWVNQMSPSAPAAMPPGRSVLALMG